MERIIGNLDKVKLKLDEAFFYLDEIEELIQEDELGDEAGTRGPQPPGLRASGHPAGSRATGGRRKRARRRGRWHLRRGVH